MADAFLPGWPRLLPAALATLGRDGQGPLPGAGLAARYRLAAIDPGHVGRYRALVGGGGSHVPLAYFYLLAQRAQLALMLDRRFPWAIPGLVHVANELRLHRSPVAGAGVDIAVTATGGPAAGARTGIVFRVELTQDGQTVVGCSSEYRPRRAGGGGHAGHGAPALAVAAPALPWTLAAATGRRYARVSGDWNPIHLAAILARPFGFRGAIAHGMYCVGRAAAAIEGLAGSPVTAIDARFRRPVPLPGTVAFACAGAAAGAGAYSIGSADGAAVYVTGSWQAG